MKAHEAPCSRRSGHHHRLTGSRATRRTAWKTGGQVCSQLAFGQCVAQHFFDAVELQPLPVALMPATTSAARRNPIWIFGAATGGRPIRFHALNCSAKTSLNGLARANPPRSIPGFPHRPHPVARRAAAFRVFCSWRPRLPAVGFPKRNGPHGLTRKGFSNRSPVGLQPTDSDRGKAGTTAPLLQSAPPSLHPGFRRGCLSFG